MYLSKILINPLRSGGNELIRNPQTLHAAVKGVLPPGTDRDSRILWRLEPGTRGAAGGYSECDAPDSWRSDPQLHSAVLLIQTPFVPTLDGIVEKAGWRGEAGEPVTASMDALMEQIAIGRSFGFRLQANPTASFSTTRSSGGPCGRAAPKKRRRYGLATHKQHEWFLRRACGKNAQWGFSVGTDPEDARVRVVARERLRFSKAAQSSPVQLDVATFEGVLTVTDAELLRRTIASGIGSAKAYGCGLLTLAPART